MSRRGWALFAAMCVIWGIPYLLIKVAVRDFSPAALVFARTLIGAALLVPVAAGRGQLRPLLRHWRPVLAYTAVEVAIPWWLLSDAERRLSSSLSGLLVAAVPLVGVVLARLTGPAEAVDLRRIAGLAVGLGGVVCLLGLDVHGGDLGAVAEVGVVTVGYASGPLIVSRRLADVPSLGVVAASLGLTTLVYAPIAAVQLPAHVPSAEVLASVAALGVVCTAAAFLLFFRLIGEIGPVGATVITYVNPAVAVALGALLLDEHVGPSTLLGFALILAGSVLATRRREVAALPAEAPTPTSVG